MPVCERTRLATLKARRHQGIEPSAHGPTIFRRAVSALELAENLGLADDHGIETGGHAKDVMNSAAALVMVEVRPQRCRVNTLVGGEEAFDERGGIAGIVGSESDFDAVTGGEDHGLRHAAAGF